MQDIYFHNSIATLRTNRFASLGPAIFTGQQRISKVIRALKRALKKPACFGNVTIKIPAKGDWSFQF